MKKNFEIMKITLFEIWEERTLMVKEKTAISILNKGEGKDFCEKVIAWTSLSRVLDRDPVETVF